MPHAAKHLLPDSIFSEEPDDFLVTTIRDSRSDFEGHFGFDGSICRIGLAAFVSQSKLPFCQFVPIQFPD